MPENSSLLNTPSYEFLHHTADVRICAYGSSLEELFRNALGGIYSILKKDYSKEKKIPHKIKVQVKSFDQTTLLIDFLSEALSQTYINKAVLECESIEFQGENAVTAEFVGYAQDSFDKDVKAITYHEAEICKEGDLFKALFIVDI